MAGQPPPLAVLQVASSLYSWGGIERYVAFLSGGLTERGHRVTVACPPQSPLASRCPDVRPIEIRRKFDLRGFAAYLRLFRSQRFDIVHGHFSPDFLLPAYAARLTRQPMTVMTRHLAVRWPRAKARMYGRLWQRIVPVSEAVKLRLIESGIPPSQMTVAKAGTPMPAVSMPRSPVRLDLGLSGPEFAVGSFGRLVPEKGIGILLDAVTELERTRTCIFGSGPEEAALRSRASARVTFHGFVEEVGSAMAAMDAVVIPSLWEEAFPYAALEAMALARPIVASRIGGLPEMVEDGVTGRLFTPGNAAELSAALTDMSNNRGATARLGQAGFARYRAEFTVDHMVDRMLDVYRPVERAFV